METLERDWPDGHHYALLSGGMDSAVSTHVAMEQGPATIAVYLDTGTGLDENRAYVEELCEEMGWQLWTLRTHESYEDRVMENGFPGPSRHSIMYRSLKERQLGRLAARSKGQAHFWTGVRSAESERRMRNVTGVQEGAGGRWTWVAPIHDWNKQRCREHIDAHGIPENPLWNTLGRSGDCFCGCFGSPEEKLDLRAVGADYHADWIEQLEDDVDRDDETGVWAWGALDDHERRAIRAESDDFQMTLCSTCEPSYPVPDGGEDDDDDE